MVSSLKSAQTTFILAPSVTGYLPVEIFPDNSLATEEDIRNFRKKVLLSAQGGPALLSGRMDFLPLLIAFGTLYGNASELAFQFPDGRRALLFDHQNNFDIRPKGVDVRVSREIERAFEKRKNSKSAAGEYMLSFDSLWKKEFREKDILEGTLQMVKNFSSFPHADKLYLKGEIPGFPADALLRVFRPLASEIFYLKSNGQIIKIF